MISDTWILADKWYIASRLEVSLPLGQFSIPRRTNMSLLLLSALATSEDDPTAVVALV